MAVPPFLASQKARSRAAFLVLVAGKMISKASAAAITLSAEKGLLLRSVAVIIQATGYQLIRWKVKRDYLSAEPFLLAFLVG